MFVEEQEVHGQFIHYLVKDRIFDFTCALTIVYGSNHMEERRDLWDGIIKIGAAMSMPWCICRDFNSPLTSEDRIGG